MNTEDEPQFEVTGHYFLPQRGAFLIGQIRGGGKWIGERIPTGDKPPLLTISGFAHNCNTQEGIYSQSLMFREQPALEFLQRVFPVGTVIPIKQMADK